MRGNPGLEFIVLDFGTKRPRVRIPPLRLLEGLIYKAFRVFRFWWICRFFLLFAGFFRLFLEISKQF